MKVMGIVNVTPDSFSDGGLHASTDAAVNHALALLDAGADIVDVGGESTRPGAVPVDEDTELVRAIPVIERVRAAAPDAVISIDTGKAGVAEAAADAGADLLNDVTASLEGTAARTGMGWIAMHGGGSAPHASAAVDIVDSVAAFLEDVRARGRRAGVEDVWIDPGIGFGKTVDQNLELIANLDRFVEIAPTVLAVSRKRTMGVLHARSDGRAEPTGPDDRLEATLAIGTWGAFSGVDIVRVHDVRATVHALGVIPR